jgi:hypothetical protein
MDDGRVVHRGAMAELAETRPCSSGCWAVAGSASMNTDVAVARRRRRADRAPKAAFDWKPVALLLALMALALPAIGSPAAGSR